MSGFKRHPSEEDLVAYLLDDLGGARLEYVDAHVRHCAECLEQIDELRELLHLLRELPEEPATADDRATIKARLVMEERERRTRFSSQLLLGATSLVVIALVGMLAWQPLAHATSSGISEFVRLVDRRGESPPATRVGTAPAGVPLEPRGTVIDDLSTLDFVPNVVDNLPADLSLVGVTSEGPEWVTLEYRSEDLRVLVFQLPGLSEPTEFGPDAETMQVRNVDVIYQTNPATEGIWRVYWFHSGIGHNLLVNRSAGFELSRSEVEGIVDRFLTAGRDR